jgi:putative transposase
MPFSTQPDAATSVHGVGTRPLLSNPSRLSIGEMASPLRIEYEGAVYHITSRGNARAQIYIDEQDLETFLRTLAESVSRFGWICHAYCLMHNHYHLLLETPRPTLSRGMQLLNGLYTQRVNRRHAQTGHLFEGRFKAILVEKETYLLELFRYIVLNPVRAGVVRSPRQWPWSSYCATAGYMQAAEFLTIDWLLDLFGRRREEACISYRQFVLEGLGVDPWEQLRAGSLLGSDRFAETVGPLLHSKPLDPNVLRRERCAARPSLRALFTGVTSKAVRDERIHEAVRVHHYTLKEVGDHLDLHFSTIISIAGKQLSSKCSKSKA